MDVVVYDHRSDGGPTMVGPFDSDHDAAEWANQQHFDLAEWCVMQLASPTEGESREHRHG